MSADTPAPGQRWRHVASGNVYRVLHLGQLRDPHADGRRWLPSVTYRRDGTEEVYTRCLNEFRKGFQRMEGD